MQGFLRSRKTVEPEAMVGGKVLGAMAEGFRMEENDGKICTGKR